MLDQETKDTLRLWHGRLSGPDVLEWIRSDEFVAFSRKYQRLFDPPDTEKSIETKQFIKQLEQEAHDASD